jgi:hypothetical protein
MKLFFVHAAINSFSCKNYEVVSSIVMILTAVCHETYDLDVDIVIPLTLKFLPATFLTRFHLPVSVAVSYTISTT